MSDEKKQNYIIVQNEKGEITDRINFDKIEIKGKGIYVTEKTE
ncbi:hypothetical protein [Tamlana sp. s12]|nr:hypothetical protein [Tamlana sp. s12]